MSRTRIAVLASGGGSNLQALIDHFASLGERRAGDIVLVASNRPEAGALVRARVAGLHTAVIRSRHAPDGHDLAALLDADAVDFIVLAGYLQLVPPDVARCFAGRMVNVHPAPLPTFGGPGMYGTHVHRAVIASDAKLSGPTIHFVDEQYDHGATIAHWPVPVLDGDDEHTLAARVLRAEHLLYPRAVQSVIAGQSVNGQLPVFDPELSEPVLGETVDRFFFHTGTMNPGEGERFWVGGEGSYCVNAVRPLTTYPEPETPNLDPGSR